MWKIFDVLWKTNKKYSHFFIYISTNTQEMSLITKEHSQEKNIENEQPESHRIFQPTWE